MAETTKIEWCDHTFNHIRGCTKVAAGCANCYADALSKRNPGTLGVWGDNGTRVLASPSYWKEPLKWNRDAEKAGVRARVFCASLADVFEDWMGLVHDHNGGELSACFNRCQDPCRWEGAYCPECGQEGTNATLDDIRRRLFALIDATPHLDWLLLTKRPENIQKMMPDRPGTYIADFAVETRFRPNVWLGTSIATQADADKNIPELLKCRDLSPVLFVSAEPLVEQIDLSKVGNPDGTCANLFDGNCLFVGDIGGADFAWTPRNFLSWLIVGGESGPHARPCDVSWIRSLRNQCAAAGVPVFVKQLGANILDRNSTSASSFPERMCWPVGFRQDVQRIILRDPKGGDMSEWPADLRIREIPQV